jgi:hypothetical protein
MAAIPFGITLRERLPLARMWPWGASYIPASIQRAKTHCVTGVNGQNRRQIAGKQAVELAGFWFNCVERHHSLLLF